MSRIHLARRTRSGIRVRPAAVALVVSFLAIAPAAAAVAAPAPTLPPASAQSATAAQPVATSAPPVRTAALAADLADLRIADPSTAAYDRDDFEHWIDADGDGCNTRSEVLQEESLRSVTFSSGCTVGTGEWFSYYDGLTWTAASDVDIDHFVPLAEAWRSGADDWTATERRSFANDLSAPETLVAVTDNENQSKSDQDPAQWLPPETSVHCQYANEWISVKVRWDLAADPAEYAALEELVAGC